MRHQIGFFGFRFASQFWFAGILIRKSAGGLGLFLYELWIELESLILAQNERWRQA